MPNIIVSLRKDHPTGTMRRCGIEFTKEKKSIEVNKETAEIIANERRLVISQDMTREIKQDAVKPESTGVSTATEGSKETTSDLDPVPSSKAKIDYEEMTISELQVMLTNAEIKFGARASKSDLIKLAKKIA